MLEIRTVVRAGGQKHDRRIGHARRRDTLQVVQQHIRIVLDRLDRVARKQLGKQPHHHLAVLEHVRHARRHAKIIFEDAEATVVVAYYVDAADVGVHAARNFDALHLRTVLGVTENLLGRDHARLQNALVVVDVGDKCIQRTDALFQTGLEPRPFIGGENTGHNVERNQPLGAGVFAVDGERNADTMK